MSIMMVCNGCFDLMQVFVVALMTTTVRELQPIPHHKGAAVVQTQTAVRFKLGRY